MESASPLKRRHTLVVLVEDHPGVLNRVVSLLRRRSFNIDTITVGASEQPGISRMTLVVQGDDQQVEQAGKQLYKLMEVLKVTDITDTNAISHELVLVKVATKPQNRQEVMLAGQIYDAKFVDATPSSLIMEVTGSPQRIESFLNMVKPYGIREMVRTGPIAMSRGGGSVQIRDGRLDRVGSVPAAAD
jgi:acetolactate synthase-1/3 small subunit